MRLLRVIYGLACGFSGHGLAGRQKHKSYSEKADYYCAILKNPPVIGSAPLLLADRLLGG